VRVVQVCIGKFHHFHLARYLHAQGDLEAIYCGYPWFKLKGEGLPRNKVRTFPWLQAPYMALGRAFGFQVGPRIRQQWEWRAQETLDKYAAVSVNGCDVLVGLSGSALRAGRVAKSRGGKYICDRGSTHIRFQDRILREENARWGVAWLGVDPRVIEKEEQEYASADLVTVPSEFTYRSFLAQGVPANRLAKIPYGANIARFSPCAAPAPDKFVVLFVGHVSIRKGIPYLLQAFADFKHCRKELWIIGSKTPDIEPVLKRFDLSRIEFKGIVPNSHLAEYYSRAHVFVLPSIEEGLAMVQGEALACGCPVIASESTGAADLFTDGREGFIVPARDAAAITARLEELAGDEPRRREMSAAALERVQYIGGWRQYGEAYALLLKHVQGSHV
jgi:glycosyltransferase involved in cell wall biosynthesis